MSYVCVDVAPIDNKSNGLWLRQEIGSGTGLAGRLRIQCQHQDTKTNFNLFTPYNCKNGFQEGAKGLWLSRSA